MKLTLSWWRSFKNRHPEISRRRTQGLEHLRRNGVSKKRFVHFFEIYKKNLDKYNYSPSKIFNMDEMGVLIDQPPKYTFTQRGKRDVHVRTSGNRTLITIVGCGSATGYAVPPCIIYPGARLNSDLVKNGVRGARYTCTSNGYMTSNAFKKYIDHFVQYSLPTHEDPVLLILDGHSSHLDIENIEYCYQNNVHIMCLPSHTSHVIQPMDLSVFPPSKIIIELIMQVGCYKIEINS